MPSQKWFEKACDELEEELDRGEITQKQYRDAMRELHDEMEEDNTNATQR